MPRGSRSEICAFPEMTAAAPSAPLSSSVNVKSTPSCAKMPFSSAMNAGAM